MRTSYGIGYILWAIDVKAAMGFPKSPGSRTRLRSSRRSPTMSIVKTHTATLCLHSVIGSNPIMELFHIDQLVGQMNF